MAPDTLPTVQNSDPAVAAEPWTLHNDPDAMLQASRRVDWRFLLPNPNLGWVAYIGPAHGSLIESLRLFSLALTIVDSAGVPTSARFDGVVVATPSRAVLRQAAGLIKPGGFLYVEARGPLKRNKGAQQGRIRFAADYVALLNQLGLVGATAYWHWPNFEACAEIVPLADRAALQLAFARRRSGTGARIKSALGHVLLQSGLFTRLAPYFSVVAQKP